MGGLCLSALFLRMKEDAPVRTSQQKRALQERYESFIKLN